MNTQQLTDNILNGRLILVGEFRNGRLQSSFIVDSSSGEKLPKHEIVYAVECGNTFGTVLIYRHLPNNVEIEKVQITLVRGQRYAFELDRFVRKANGVIAHLSCREPERLEPTGSGLTSDVRP